MKRKLTKKSQMKFGKYEALSVQQVLDLHYQDYLIWVYCNMSNIDFFEDILDELFIPVADRIEKPGTNKDIFKTLKDNYYTQMTKDMTREERIHFLYSVKRHIEWKIGAQKRARICRNKNNRSNSYSFNTTK